MVRVRLHVAKCRALGYGSQTFTGMPRRCGQARVSRCLASAQSQAPGPSKELVYFATFPLVGFERLESALVFSGGELPEVMAQHCAVIVESVAVSTFLLSQ